MENRYYALNRQGGVVKIGPTVKSVEFAASGIGLGLADGGGKIVDHKLHRWATCSMYPQTVYYWHTRKG